MYSVDKLDKDFFNSFMKKYYTNESSESQYADALLFTLKTGVLTENRTGIDTVSKQHFYFLIDNLNNNFPILKGKKLFPHMALTEMLWFLQGRTDIKWLNDHNVHYWDSWQNAEGNIGKSYGYQFRNFNGFDQVQYVLEQMEKNPMSRRMIINLWNAGDMKDMELEPCVYDYHFECVPVFDNMYNIELHVKQRSADMFLGVPYDFMLVGWITKLFSAYLNQLPTRTNLYIPKKIHYTTDNSHIYFNHTDAVKQYLENITENKDNVLNGKMVPVFKLENIHTSFDSFINEIIESWDGKKYSKVEINKDYVDVYPQIKAPVAI